MCDQNTGSAAGHLNMDQISDVKSMQRQSSACDPNNNQIVVVDDAQTEPINGSRKGGDGTESDDNGGVADDDNSESVLSDGDFDALLNEEDPTTPQNAVNSDPYEDAEEGADATDNDDNETHEPYDLDKDLISTFLEHTTSIVRSAFNAMSFYRNLP